MAPAGVFVHLQALALPFTMKVFLQIQIIFVYYIYSSEKKKQKKKTHIFVFGIFVSKYKHASNDIIWRPYKCMESALLQNYYWKLLYPRLNEPVYAIC